jgi:hypothetical protein
MIGTTRNGRDVIIFVCIDNRWTMTLFRISMTKLSILPSSPWANQISSCPPPEEEAKTQSAPNQKNKRQQATGVAIAAAAAWCISFTN